MTPFTDRAGRFSALKTLTFAVLLFPAAWLLYRYWTFDLGPLPYKEANHMMGDWAIRFVVAALALTPAQRAFNWSKIALIRRMTGIGAFTYAILHFVLYIADVKYNLAFATSEIIHRYYLTIGFTALLGLSVLAATSTDWAVRTLGKRWKQLHRIVYGIAVLALLHFFMQSKIDVSQATWMAGFYILLMIYRLVINRRIALTAPVLAASAAGAALATAAIEFAWYGLTTGVNPWRVLSANLMLQFGLRPAAIVLLTGIAVAAIPLVRASLAWTAAIPRVRLT